MLEEEIEKRYRARLVYLKVDPEPYKPKQKQNHEDDTAKYQSLCSQKGATEEGQNADLNGISDNKAARVRAEFFEEYRKREEGRLEYPPVARYPISSEFEKWRALARYQIKKIGDPQKIEDYRQRQHAERKIQALNHILLEGWYAKPRVFLSYNYERAGHEVANYVKAVFEKRNFDVIDGRNLVGSENIFDELLSLIQSCKFLVAFAIRTSDALTQHLSPWLIWEYGIATVHCDDYRLVVHDGVEIPEFANHRYIHHLPNDITSNQDQIETVFDRIAQDFKQKWRNRYWKHP